MYEYTQHRMAFMLGWKCDLWNAFNETKVALHDSVEIWKCCETRNVTNPKHHPHFTNQILWDYTLVTLFSPIRENCGKSCWNQFSSSSKMRMFIFREEARSNWIVPVKYEMGFFCRPLGIFLCIGLNRNLIRKVRPFSNCNNIDSVYRNVASWLIFVAAILSKCLPKSSYKPQTCLAYAYHRYLIVIDGLS